MSRPDYDSFIDEPDTERGYGLALGGAGRRQTVRARGRWRATAAHHAKLTAVDMVMVALPVPVFTLAWFLRSQVAFIAGCVLVLWMFLWFRTQRMQHAKRGPGAY